MANTETAGKAWHWFRLSQDYTGVWTNDGEYSVDGATWGAAEGDRITLAITVYGREVGGDIHGDRLCNFLPWKYVSVEGYTKWWGFGGIRARAFDHIGGRKTQFAEFDMHREWRSGKLVVETLDGAPTFPARAVLLKANEAEGQSVSDHGVQSHCPSAFAMPPAARSKSPASSSPGKTRQ